MNRWDAVVEVMGLPGIADPQGNAIERALTALGYSTVSDVRVGKIIRFVVQASDAAAAHDAAASMCERLLANPVIETSRLTVTPCAAPSCSDAGT